MDLLVHPDSTKLIVYPGGYCGEFLAWWLSLHPGCIKIGHRNIGNNRYSGQHKYNYVYSKQGTKDLLFLTAHPGQNVVSKIGVAVPHYEQHIILYASKRTHRFYFLLYLIKTVFYKYTVAQPPMWLFKSPDHWPNFVQNYLNGRIEFTGTEIECWEQGIPCKNSTDIVVDAWCGYKFCVNPHGIQEFDIDGLFIGNYARAYDDLCSRFHITPQDKFNHHIPEYHQRNVALVEKYINMPLDIFLDLDDESAMPIITQSMLTRSKESHLLV
jgi:hypothetical protein